MMNKRKLLIISILLLFVVAMSLSAVSASKTKTTTIKIHKQTQIKEFKNNDCLMVIYQKYNAAAPKGVSVYADSYGGQNVAQHTKLIKAKVWYKKKKKVITRSAKTRDGSDILLNLVKGYKPYKIKIWYKTY